MREALTRDKHGENSDGRLPRLLECIHSAPVLVGADANTPFNESVLDVLRPRKLIEGSPFTAPEFLSHMARLYCEHHAILMRAAYASNFSKEFATALILFVMEQWWFGIHYVPLVHTSSAPTASS